MAIDKVTAGKYSDPVYGIDKDLATAVNALIDAQAITVTPVTSPYTLLQTDSAAILVFDDDDDATIDIPADLDIATNFMTANVGAGIVTLTSNGSEVFRGSSVLGDEAGMMSAVKLTALIWQTSERI